MEHRIEVVETAYEFMLAYAAQGREDDATAAPGQQVRTVLTGLDEALAGLENTLGPSEPFHAVVRDDIGRTRKALALVLGAPRISSELVDNLNASLHLRAVLTDLFLISEAARIRASS